MAKPLIPHIYLSLHDFASAIKDEHLTAITTGGQHTEHIIRDAVIATATEIQSYLRGKYNIDVLFPVVTTWDNANEYTAGEMVHIDADNTWFTALITVPVSTAITSTTHWESGDPRDALIVEFMLDLVLYRLHTRVAPNQVPETRIQRRDDAISFLKKVAAYDITVGWDQDDEILPASINWGSNEKESKIY